MTAHTHRRPRRAIAAGCAVALAALVAAEAPAQPRAARDSAGLARLRAAFVAAYDRGDAAAMAALYTDDAVRLPPDAPLQRGRTAIVAGYQASFAQRTLLPALELSTDAIAWTGDGAVEYGRYHERLSPRRPADTLAEDGKWMALSRRRADGSWQYVWSMFNRDARARVVGRVPRDTLAHPAAISLATATWVSWGRGLDAALLDGDPAVPGRPYTVALRMRDGSWISPHWHPNAKQVVVLGGTLLMGH
ncbi:MAG TPA: SgcJ/EcaC family oxidoreductase, partial [Gemmatimonadaceae bacterium]|nr:SgcJ/EcaC family oxidoreductase [Gemmatimonadaceae bacterium]